MLNEISSIVADLKLPHVTLRKLRSHLQARDSDIVPSVSTLGKVLKAEFQLSFRMFNSANLRYNSRYYDKKRLLISKLLLTFLLDCCEIVCIDESGFNTINLSSRQWQTKTTFIMKHLQQ